MQAGQWHVGGTRRTLLASRHGLHASCVNVMLSKGEAGAAGLSKYWKRTPKTCSSAMLTAPVLILHRARGGSTIRGVLVALRSCTKRTAASKPVPPVGKLTLAAVNTLCASTRLTATLLTGTPAATATCDTRLQGAHRSVTHGLSPLLTSRGATAPEVVGTEVRRLGAAR